MERSCFHRMCLLQCSGKRSAHVDYLQERSQRISADRTLHPVTVTLTRMRSP